MPRRPGYHSFLSARARPSRDGRSPGDGGRRDASSRGRGLSAAVDPHRPRRRAGGDRGRRVHAAGPGRPHAGRDRAVPGARAQPGRRVRPAARAGTRRRPSAWCTSWRSRSSPSWDPCSSRRSSIRSRSSSTPCPASSTSSRRDTGRSASSSASTRSSSGCAAPRRASNAGGVLGQAGSALAAVEGIAATVVGLIIIAFLTFFMLLEGPEWRRRCTELIPEPQPAASSSASAPASTARSGAS